MLSVVKAVFLVNSFLYFFLNPDLLLLEGNVPLEEIVRGFELHLDNTEVVKDDVLDLCGNFHLDDVL